jgi:hypothetical protein
MRGYAMRPLRLAALLTFCIGGGCAWQGLFTQPAPEEQLEYLVQHITAHPDWMHAGYSSETSKLINLGDPAIPRMLDLMLLDGKYDRFTREHAQTVLYHIMCKKYGFESGRGWSDPHGQERADALWKSLGDLDADAPLEEREGAVKLWREWLANGCKT